jgi:D-alanyl-D-alanine-carboxypeptidase/D-alanyl-D-alanine-endopeptidase
MKNLLLLILALSSTAAAQSFPSDSAIFAIIKQRVDDKRSAGIVIGLLEADGRRRYFAYGDPGPGQPPLDSNSVFEIGSITKVFTGALLAQMILTGEVKLDDPLQKHLPDSVKMPAPKAAQITLKLLANHRSGLPRLPRNIEPRDPQNPYADYTVEKLYAFLSNYQLTRDPGAEWEYSNLGVGVLGHALGRAAGKPWDQLQRERIWAPLRMTRTTIALTPWHREHLALGHGPDGKVVPNWDLPIETFAPAGAIRSTAADMLTFLEASIRADTSRFLWAVRSTPTDTIVWHNGGTGGYRSWAGFVASRRMAVVVLTNSGGAGADDIGLHLLDSTLPLRSADEEMTMAFWLLWSVGVVALLLAVGITVFWRRRLRPREEVRLGQA